MTISVETNFQEVLKGLEKATLENNQAIIEKCNSILEKQEEKNQKLVLELAQTKKAQEEINENFKSLELSIQRFSANSNEYKEASAEMKSYVSYLNAGERGSDFQVKTLRTSDNTDGGYLVPTEVDREIIKKITEVSAIDQLARVKTMTSKAIEQRVRTSIPSSGMVGELETGSTSTSKYGLNKLVAKAAYVNVDISWDELNDADVNLVNEINTDVAEEFARIRGAQFVNGNNSPKQVQGLYSNDAGITSINSGNASAITFDSLIQLTGELKTGYNPVYAFNRKTLAAIRQLKDGSNAYIWQAGNLGAGIPNQINGFNYAIVPDMPDIAVNAFPVIFGDFAKGYTIGNRQGISVIRDEVTRKKDRAVEFSYFIRFAGVVNLPEAFIKLKVSA